MFNTVAKKTVFIIIYMKGKALRWMRLKIKTYFKKGTDTDNIFSEFFSFCASVC